MSNLMIALLTVFAFAGGLGLGLVLVMRPPSVKPRRGEEHVHSDIYFGRDDEDDHPHDIERQGSLSPRLHHLNEIAEGRAGTAAERRAPAHRYDGMADGDTPHVPVGARGLDFGSTPR